MTSTTQIRLRKESLYEVEDIPFAYTEVSLNKLYELSLKQALQVIEQEGGSVICEPGLRG